MSALLDSEGQAGWTANLSMLKDPLFAHFADRVEALAEEKVAEEADRSVLSEEEFVALDNYGESSPTTAEAMFALLRDRLEDLDERLLLDTSPREVWQSIDDEKLLRWAISSELNNMVGTLNLVSTQPGSTQRSAPCDKRGGLDQVLELTVLPGLGLVEFTCPTAGK